MRRRLPRFSRWSLWVTLRLPPLRAFFQPEPSPPIAAALRGISACKCESIISDYSVIKTQVSYCF